MSNPFQPLQQVLRTLAENAKILLATGQAVMDMVTPDVEEIRDRHTAGEAAIHIVWETDVRVLYHTLEPIPRTQEHGFCYFVDDSARTDFIGTLFEQGRSTPVQLSQVGVAMVKRENDGRIRVAASRHKILLILEKSQVSEQLWKELERALKGIPKYDLCDSTTNHTYTDMLGLREPRPRGAHRANWYMRRLEVELAQSVPRDGNAWLVVDGSLSNEFDNWRGTPLVGVAKTFRRDSQFKLGSGPRAKRLNLFTLLKDLKENQCTIVFPRSGEGKIVFWYVRISPQKGLDYPLMGVVNVEMPNPDREPVDSALADRISNWLITERTETSLGRGRRWYTHLHPTYIARCRRSVGIIPPSAHQFLRAIQERVTDNSISEALARMDSAKINGGNYRFSAQNIPYYLSCLEKDVMTLSRSIYPQSGKTRSSQPSFRQGRIRQ